MSHTIGTRCHFFPPLRIPSPHSRVIPKTIRASFTFISQSRENAILVTRVSARATKKRANKAIRSDIKKKRAHFIRSLINHAPFAFIPHGRSPKGKNGGGFPSSALWRRLGQFSRPTPARNGHAEGKEGDQWESKQWGPPNSGTRRLIATPEPNSAPRRRYRPARPTPSPPTDRMRRGQ